MTNEVVKEAVKIVAKRATRGDRVYESYSVSIPARFMRELGFKAGELLLVRVAEIDVDGRKERGLFYYKA